MDDSRLTTLLLDDSFAADTAAGAVIGSSASDGGTRLGTDVEARLSIDHGALRIEPLEVPGWGRCGLAYGPYEATPGLVACFLLLNGHNESQTEPHLAPSRRDARHVVRALRYRWRRWRRRTHQDPEHWPTIPPRKVAAHRHDTPVQENLAVGWFSAPAASAPDGHSLQVHATRGANGELWAPASSGSRPRRLFDLLQNLPTYYVVLLRPSGAAYYVASTPGGRGPGSYPDLRPIAIDPVTAPGGQRFAGLQQSILGQVGYRAATRVYGARVAEVPEWAAWYGTAHLADQKPLRSESPEIGGTWTTGTWGRAIDPGAPTGLVHMRLEACGADPRLTLTLRAPSPGDGLQLEVTTTGSRLVQSSGDRWATVAEDPEAVLGTTSDHWLDVLDDGERVSVHLDDRLVFARFVECPDEGAGTGLALCADDLTVRDLEAHPRRVRLPDVLDLGLPHLGTGGEVAVQDSFVGAAGELDDIWSRALGQGVIERTGRQAARVRATPEQRNPGRTLYLHDWRDPKFADLEVEITPPGDGRDDRHEGRAGLAVWQDGDNYLVVNVWLASRFPGSSVSSFLRIGGREDFFDPVWSNVGTAIRPGRPIRLRLLSDGSRYLVHLDGRPVLYRAFVDIDPDAERFSIERAGLAVNWEWGDDTGSEFRDYRARTSR